MSKTHDRAATPHRRAADGPALSRMPAIRMNAQYKKIRPAALSRQILALTGQLEAIATATAGGIHLRATTPRSRRY